jgi:hypothetical protein
MPPNLIRARHYLPLFLGFIVLKRTARKVVLHRAAQVRRFAQAVVASRGLRFPDEHALHEPNAVRAVVIFTKFMSI